VTKVHLEEIFPGNNDINETHVTHFQNALKTGKFHTCHRQAHFFSQVKVETNNLKSLAESGKYRLHAALGQFGGKESTKDWYKQSFYDDKDYLDYFHYQVYEKTNDSTESYTGQSYQTYKWKSSSTSDTVRVPTVYASQKGYFKKLSFTKSQTDSKEKKFFSAVYANKYGNGAPSTEDGYKYRGQGAIQLTWKDNYKDVSTKCNNLFNTSYNWETNPSEVSTDLKAAIYSAVAYFHFRLKDDLKLLDGTDMNAVSKAVNGGTNGLSERQSAFNSLIDSSIFNNCKPKSPKNE
jgi:predicted chitinase